MRLTDNVSTTCGCRHVHQFNRPCRCLTRLTDNACTACGCRLTFMRSDQPTCRRWPFRRLSPLVCTWFDAITIACSIDGRFLCAVTVRLNSSKYCRYDNPGDNVGNRTFPNPLLIYQSRMRNSKSIHQLVPRRLLIRRGSCPVPTAPGTSVAPCQLWHRGLQR